MIFFVVYFLFNLATCNISVKQVSEHGFVLHFDQVEDLKGERFHWLVRHAQEIPSMKELLNGVTTIGEGCSGTISRKQIRARSSLDVRCKLQFGKQYTLDAVAIEVGKDPTIYSADFDFSYRRRLLNTPTIEPTISPTFDPTISPTFQPTVEPSQTPTIDPTIAPTFDPTIAPTYDPTISPTFNPTLAPTSVGAITSTTTAASSSTTAPIGSDSSNNDDEDATFVGFELSSISGLFLFIFAVMLLIVVLALISAGPCIYRRYYETFGAKTIPLPSSPQKTASLSEIWEETVKNTASTVARKLSSMTKTKSFGKSESKIEIAPMKSEDKIRCLEPVE